MLTSQFTHFCGLDRVNFVPIKGNLDALGNTLFLFQHSLTSTPANTFGTSYEDHCKLGLVAQHQWPTHGSKLQESGTKSLWKAFP